MRLIIATALLLSWTVQAQQVGQNVSTTSDGTTVLKVSSQLVIETVSVKDKKANPVSGLTQKDFTVTENGAPQNIRVFEYQALAEPTAVAMPPTPAYVKPYNKLSHFEIEPEPKGSGKYRDKRLLALYFDMGGMDPGDQYRALSAAEKFIRTEMQPQDMFAILRYWGSSVEVLQDFTNDRTRLLSIFATLAVGEDRGYDNSTSGDAATSDSGSAFGQDDTEFNIFNTDRQLSALQTAASMLGRLSEKKCLVYFASGLRLNSLDNQAQLHATINSAIRAGVSFWPIDARGLVASAPLGDATQGSSGGSQMYTGSSALAMTNRMQQSQDTLYALAGDTGGRALLDTNDLGRGILNAERSISSYYIVGYYTTNTAKDGKYRRVKVALNRSNLDADLDYRQGYYANKEFSNFNVADKERQLEDALMLPDPITDLTIAMEVDFFQLNHAEYFVPLTVKIPGRELALAKRSGAERTNIDFIGEIKDDAGGTVANVRDKASAKLSDTDAAEIVHHPIVYSTGFTLLPGRYTIKFLARDDETGRIGSYQAAFEIPNLDKEDQRLPISSVVLSSQRAALKDAIYNAQKRSAKAAEQHPLVENGLTLVPSVTRVFQTSQTMFVYLQAYEPRTKSASPIVAQVSLYRDGQRVFESTPTVVAKASGQLNTIALEFAIPLRELAPGEYECQVTVIDPSGGKVNFWRTTLAVG
jgi:VWFA-related protein